MKNIEKVIEELFKRKVHLGHKKNRLHPKAKKYIYTIENGTSIIDLTQTVSLLEKAKKFISELASHGKTLLVVATKKSAVSAFDLCQKNQIPLINVKWPAGLLTNFDNIIKNVKKLKTLKEEKQNGAWEKFVKHERVKLEKQLRKLEKLYGGIANLEKLPDALFIIDIKTEKNAVYEAKKLKIPIVALVDTNSDPTQVEYPIIGNDDLSESVEYFINEIINTYVRYKKT